MSTAKLNFPQPLTEKYRPRAIEDFVGLQKPRKVLESFISKPFDSAWLFLGPSGVGKTTMALAISETLGAELHHVPSRSCDLDTVDSVTRMCHMGAFNFTTGKSAPWHVVLVDEADQMTPAAQNSLLSKLDATASPPNTIWFFTANSVAALEGRFLSRCRVLDFKNDTLEGELEDYLKRIYKKEGGKFPVGFEDMCKASSYNVRDALMKLEVEVMIGTDRDDLPSEDIKIVEDHTHSCKGKCKKPWKHRDPMCELPFRSVCPQCGGSTTVGQERAKKAWDTIRAKITEQVKSESKTRKRRSKHAANR